MVIIGTDRQLYAMDAKYGKKIWDFYRAGGQPVLTNIRTYGASPTDGSVFAIDKFTGNTDWTSSGRGFNPSTDFALGNNTLVFGRGNTIVGLDSRSGEGLKWQMKLDSALAAAPIIVGNVTYAICRNGKLYALDLETGAELSHIDIEVSDRSSISFCIDKLIYSNGKAVFFIGSE